MAPRCFLKQPHSLHLLSFYLFPLCESLYRSFHIFCPLSLSLLPIFPLFRDHTLPKSARFTLSDRNHSSSNKQSFSTLVLFISLLRLSFSLFCLSLLCFFLAPSSFITHHLVWRRETAYSFHYNILDNVMFLQCLTTELTVFTIKCIAHAKCMQF